MKTDKIELKWQIFFNFVIFSACVIFVFWIFQIVLLNQFYSSMKISSATELTQKIVDIIDETSVTKIKENDEESIRTLLTLGDEYESDIIILLKHDTSTVRYECIYLTSNILTKDIKRYVDIVVENEGKSSFYKKSNDFSGEVNYICGQSEIIESGDEVTIVISTKLFPVERVIDVLRKQFQIITLITILLAIIFALMLARQVSLPISRINEAAKLLAKGKYDTTFEGHGYLEITELNDTLNYAAQELGKLDGYQKELIANISHDLRTPLTLITGYSEMMHDLPNEMTPENLQVVIDESKRLTSLVNDILNLTKMQSATGEFEKETYSLTSSIKDIIYRMNKMQESNNISFEYQDEVFINADQKKMDQVIYNFISNAINHGGDDHLVIVRQEIEDIYVKISVIDHGEGIPENEINNVWNRYYKTKSSHRRATIGSGLGLSIVKSVLDKHGFEYGVESIVNEGSTFWFKAKITDEN